MTEPVQDPFDLDAHRAARREASSSDPLAGERPIKVGGEVVATLPAEFPLDVLSPLESLNFDVALLVRAAMDAARNKGGTSADATDLAIDMLVSNPALPLEVLQAVREMAKRLLGEPGYRGLVDARLSRDDLGVLVKGMFVKYGVSLGEASASTDSAGDADGETSNATSNGSTGSTPVAPGKGRGKKALSGSAV